MQKEGPDKAQGDKMRLCPTCRMQISVLATKCRYCGETVSRPREEIRRLSVTDLGGEHGEDYAVNEDVLDALEAFRREEIEQTTRTPQTSQPGKSRKPVLPSRTKPMQQYQHLARPTIPTPVLIAIVCAALLIGGYVVYSKYFARSGPPPVLVSRNPAAEILRAGGSGLEALSAAIVELRAAATPENESIAEECRQKVKSDVDALFNADPWSIEKLNQASVIASRAIDIDPGSATLKALKKEVDDELSAYKMGISNIDVGAGKVMLRINHTGGREPDVVVKERGNRVEDRFVVKRIAADGVTFEDPLRKGKGGLSRTFRLSKDGEIRLQ